ncbi:MAG: agmatine deiminase family protein, partial [Ilumatobacteraceae bacterium]
MPAEFSRHERTVICWPARSEIYGSRLAEAQIAHAALANTISGYEPVSVIA